LQAKELWKEHKVRKKAKEPRINGGQISGAKSLKTHTTLATSTLIIILFSNMLKFSKKKISKNKACKGKLKTFWNFLRMFYYLKWDV
jgi:hypothetical protein